MIGSILNECSLKTRMNCDNLKAVDEIQIKKRLQQELITLPKIIFGLILKKKKKFFLLIRDIYSQSPNIIVPPFAFSFFGSILALEGPISPLKKYKYFKNWMKRSSNVDNSTHSKEYFVPLLVLLKLDVSRLIVMRHRELTTLFFYIGFTRNPHLT